MRQCDLILSRLIGSVVPEGSNVADARRSHVVVGLVEGLGEDVGGAAEKHVCFGHLFFFVYVEFDPEK